MWTTSSKTSPTVATNVVSPPPQGKGHHHMVAYHLLPALTAVGVTVFLLLLLFFIWRRLFRNLYCRRGPPSAPLPRRFSYSVLRRATAAFSPSRRLGQGGFGAVFSGTLSLAPTCSTIPIAVKLMDSGSLQGEREFHNELLIAHNTLHSDRLVKLLGFASSRRRRRMCLVYELMPNGNLQDCLLYKKCQQLMDWNNRFRIALQVAQGLAFLHHHCHPPVIHGDIKPSNILLDDNFCAKIGDFGLARLKFLDNYINSINDDHVVVDIEGIKGSTYNGNKGNNFNCNNMVGVVGIEDSGSIIETESVTTTAGFEEASLGVDLSPVRVPLGVETSPEMVTAVASPADFFDKGEDGFDLEGQFDRVDVENSDKEMVKIGKGKRKGKPHRQDDEGESNRGQVKEYVMEWMGTEITKGCADDCVKQEACSSSVGDNKAEKKKKKKKKFEWWGPFEEGKISKRDKRRPAREWWKEEYSEELARKTKKKKKKAKKKNQGPVSEFEGDWWPRDDEMDSKERRKKKSRRRSNVDWWLDGLSGDGHTHTSYDSMSGEIPKSGGISSTPSMRGTVCYVAPEYSNTGAHVSEKCDVYSYGVLLLVLIAGRRPLQVTGSPISEFHRANLVSWARHLARASKLLDLVDKNMTCLNRQQAQLCLVVALLCLHKSPARRPSMKEVVGMLTGELDPPQLPLDYAPSPASQFPFKPRKRLR